MIVYEVGKFAGVIGCIVFGIGAWRAFHLKSWLSFAAWLTWYMVGLFLFFHYVGKSRELYFEKIYRVRADN